MTKRPVFRGFAVKGELLRDLRRQRGWTQADTARRGKVSERLLRKAENGGLIDSRSAQLLANLFSTPQAPLAIENLLAAGSPATPAAVLQRLLTAVWTERRLEIIDELMSPAIAFHCESGQLSTLASIRQRAENFHRQFSDRLLEIDRLSEQSQGCSCRWRLTRPAPGAGNEPASVGATTTIYVVEGLIVAGWEFWDPQLGLRRQTAT